MTDVFAQQVRSTKDPVTDVTEISPADASDLPFVTTGLSVATPGTVRVTMLNGSIGDLKLVPGTLFPARVTRVWHTGTTATGICGFT